MDFTKQIDALSMGYSILCFKGVTDWNFYIMMYLYP